MVRSAGPSSGLLSSLPQAVTCQVYIIGKKSARHTQDLGWESDSGMVLILPQPLATAIVLAYSACPETAACLLM